MPYINGDRMAAEFLRGEPDYDKPAWIDTYAMTLGKLRPAMSPCEASNLAAQAFNRQAWCNPKIAAWSDASFGPIER